MAAAAIVGVGDAVLLDPVTEDAFVENLRKRFLANEIYTYIGAVVVSMNPYQRLNIYTKSLLMDYSGRNLYELPPHIYALTDSAYRSMKDDNKDQVVIITGESGSGKTEASKIIMQYVAEVTGKGADVDRVKDQLLKCNPMLEAFGNAKTNRNDNSSRFGKYMDMQFNYNGDPIGGVITEYLLEKSRVVHQMAGERNFHIFYQLLSGADSSLLSQLLLTKRPQDYNYLNQSGCTNLDTMDDKEEWKLVQEAFKVMGFDEREKTQLLQLISAILHIGNISFKGYALPNGVEATDIERSSNLDAVCKLLGTTSETLTQVLTRRNVTTRLEKVETTLSVSAAKSTRDGLCKAIYSRLFSWLIKRVNQSIAIKNRNAKKRAIGVLDIYGFEIFQENSFEQFIINYCNEKLQQIFIELTLKSEQDEYVREGIAWTHVEYFNNAVICELIESKNGILSTLDDACLRPGNVTDQQLLTIMGQNPKVENHAHYESRTQRKLWSDKSLPENAFRLVHYAGKVTYSIDGFIAKNQDTLYADLARFMYGCSNALSKELFQNDGRVMGGETASKRPVSLSKQFMTSVSELMNNLLTKQPHYIRCIKPNDTKTKGKFDVELVRHQVRYLGLMENVRVRRAGFAFRLEYEKFLERYKMLSRITWPKWKGSPRDGVKHILVDGCDLQASEFAWGRSKIFIRNPQTVFAIEDRRAARRIQLLIKIQSIYRGWKKRMEYKKMRKAQITISSHYKGMKARNNYKETREGCVMITSMWRMWKERRKYAEYVHGKEKVSAQIIIAAHIRGYLVRKRLFKHFRKNAGPVLFDNLLNFQKRMLLRSMSSNLPPRSPTDRTSIQAVAPKFRKLAGMLQQAYHVWRCKLYREKINAMLASKPNVIKDMRMKLLASQLFKGKKLNYPSSVGTRFAGNYLDLSDPLVAPKWEKACQSLQFGTVRLAAAVSKVNRSDTTLAERYLIISDGAVLILDKSFKLKYQIDIKDITKLSTSSQSDELFVLHVHLDKEEKAKSKGDHIFTSEHVIEILTQLYHAFRKLTNKDLDLVISDNFSVNFSGKKETQIEYSKSEQASMKKKGRRLQVLVEEAKFADEREFRARGGSIRERPKSLLFADSVENINQASSSSRHRVQSAPASSSKEHIQVPASAAGPVQQAQSQRPATSDGGGSRGPTAVELAHRDRPSQQKPATTSSAAATAAAAAAAPSQGGSRGSPQQQPRAGHHQPSQAQQQQRQQQQHQHQQQQQQQQRRDESPKQGQKLLANTIFKGTSDGEEEGEEEEAPAKHPNGNGNHVQRPLNPNGVQQNGKPANNPFASAAAAAGSGSSEDLTGDGSRGRGGGPPMRGRGRGNPAAMRGRGGPPANMRGGATGGGPPSAGGVAPSGPAGSASSRGRGVPTGAQAAAMRARGRGRGRGRGAFKPGQADGGDGHAADGGDLQEVQTTF